MSLSRKLVVALVAAAECLVPAMAALAAAATNTVNVSGQVSGGLTVETAESCRPASLDFSNGTGTHGVQLDLTDHTAKPSTGVWAVAIYVLHTGKTHFVVANGTNAAGELTISSDGIAAWEWVTKSGTATVSSNYKHGSFHLVLIPSHLRTNATQPETVVGNWSCD